jgi:hypothetical protein
MTHRVVSDGALQVEQAYVCCFGEPKRVAPRALGALALQLQRAQLLVHQAAEHRVAQQQHRKGRAACRGAAGH